MQGDFHNIVANYVGITSGYGLRKITKNGVLVDQFHKGVDISAAEGTPIFAAMGAYYDTELKGSASH